MKIFEFAFTDHTRARNVPVCLYCPDNFDKAKIKLPLVIFGAGYQEQAEILAKGAELAYTKYEYLAEFFTSKNYCFVSIQHDIAGDKDGIETIDPKAVQVEVRQHLWQRGIDNILFVINELKKQFPNFDYNKFIVAGHSNGGDIAKFFAFQAPELTESVIVLDSRRCPIKTNTALKILMFEANDTTTDIGVIPEEDTANNKKRNNLEWIIIKPKNATHYSYNGRIITAELKNKVLTAIEWFLEHY